MPELADHAVCTGCGACVAACPTAALSLQGDGDGFLFPVADATHCIDCGKCMRACPELTPPRRDGENDGPTFFAAQLRTREELDEVSSGGAFWALAQTVLAKGGVLYGAQQVSSVEVRHVRVDDLAGAATLRRSKYLPSEVGPAFADVKRDLDAGRLVLFTGTPCQIAGLLGFLDGPNEHLITCEVVCHGIPTPKAWRAYVAEKEKARGRRVVSVNFRDKTAGWRRTQYRIVYDDGTEEVEYIGQNAFHAAYLRGLISRQSCGTCRYARVPRIADITLADFWKYHGAKFAVTADDGVSLIVANSGKGVRLVIAFESKLFVFDLFP